MLKAIEKSFDTRLQERIGSGTFGGVPKIKNYIGHYRTIGSISYNGEKTYGEMGPIKDYYLDYDGLRARSWQLYLESELAQIIINNFITWVIGNGLKLQAEPMKDVLKAEGITLDPQKFSKSVEAQFKLYSKSRMSDYSDMQNLNFLETEGFKNAKIGGDVLVILRYIEGTVKVQLIDGEHVRSPRLGNQFYPTELENGNRMVNGIEINSKGQHVAYWILKDYRTQEFERVEARGSVDSSALTAYMVYGSKYRLDNYRGMPLLSVMFETAKKLERYKEATVGSAEERQKIAYAVEHDAYSTGESPWLKQSVMARNVELSRQDGFIPIDDAGKAIANHIGVTTEKMAFNMPLGSHLVALESKNELYFKEFYETNIMLFCASAGIPYEVAMSRYDSNYSASRGAIKDWEHKLNVSRAQFSVQFMQPIYEFWLEVRAFQRKIYGYQKYIQARKTSDRMVMEAMRNARFVGPPVPHIDPEKEVKAERLKLGDAGLSIPLTTVEQATENLGGGDSTSNIEQYADELKKSKSLGIKVEPKPAAAGAPAKKSLKKKKAA
jgi:capsid protein